MESVIIFIIVLYTLSASGYFAYFFVQKNNFHKIGYYLLLAGFIFHSAYIISGYIKSGQMPVHNLHGTLSIVSWSVSGVFLILKYKYDLRILGIFAAPFSACIMIVAIQFPGITSGTDKLFESLLLIVHVVTIFIGEASLALAFGVGLLYLLQEHTIKTKRHGFFYKRLPSLDLLDNTGYACIVAGFTFLTTGLIIGCIYAKLVWGKFWSWDPKEVWSGITWLVYAALLHERLTVGWRGRRAAIMAIIGFIVLLFTFFGVNFLLQGHHGNFTRW